MISSPGLPDLAGRCRTILISPPSLRQCHDENSSATSMAAAVALRILNHPLPSSELPTSH